jgi:hypothetical protein
VSHDDHVDGLNHKLGLLVALGLLGRLGETGSLSDSSSLGSEMFALSADAAGHLLLVSGMLSKFSMVSLKGSGLDGALSLEMSLSFLVSLHLSGMSSFPCSVSLHLSGMSSFPCSEGLHLSGMSSFLCSEGLHLSGVCGTSSMMGLHFHGVSGALLGEEHLLSLDESSTTEGLEVSHFLGMGFLGSSDSHASLVSSDSGLVGFSSGDSSEVLFVSQGFEGISSFDGKHLGLVGSNSGEVSSMGSSLGSTNGLGFLQSSHVSLVGKSSGSEGFSSSISGLLLTEGGKFFSSEGFGLCSFDLKGKGSSSSNSKFMSANSGEMCLSSMVGLHFLGMGGTFSMMGLHFHGVSVLSFHHSSMGMLFSHLNFPGFVRFHLNIVPFASHELLSVLHELGELLGLNAVIHGAQTSTGTSRNLLVRVV